MCFWVASVICLSEVHGADETELRSAFIDAAEQMPQTLDQLNIHVRILESYESEAKPGKSESRVTTHEAACQGSSFQLRSEAVDEAVIVTAINDKYAFEVRLTEDGPELVYLQQLGQSEASDSAIRSAINELGVRHVMCSGYFLSVPIADLVKMPGFSIDSMSEVDRSGEKYVRINHSIPESLELAPVVENAYMIANPAKGWSIVESSNDCRYPEHGFTDTYKYTVLESDLVQDVELTRELVSTTVRSDGDYESIAKFSVEVLDTDPPVEMFFLSHYGLPEPNFSNPNSNLVIWFFSLSAIFVAGWFILGKLEKKSTKARPQK